MNGTFRSMAAREQEIFFVRILGCKKQDDFVGRNIEILFLVMGSTSQEGMWWWWPDDFIRGEAKTCSWWQEQYLVFLELFLFLGVKNK